MDMTRKQFLATGGRAALGAASALASVRLDAALGRASSFAFLSARDDPTADVLESDAVRRIHRYLEEHQEEHLAKVQAFLRQPSVSSWNMGITECAEMLRGYFKEIGCRRAELVPTAGHPGVFAHYDGAGAAAKTISTYMMYDTQPYEEKAWSSPPLAANRVKMDPFREVIIARGAINSKGPIRAFLNACEAILAVEGKLPLNIVFTCDGEEEQGSPHFHEVLAPYHGLLKGCSAHLVPGPSQDRDGNVQMALGNKGIAYVELECSGRSWGRGPQKMPIHSSRKAVLDSPVWRLVNALSSMVSEDGNTIRIEGYTDAIRPPTEEDLDLINTLLRKFPGRLLASERENVKSWMNGWSVDEAVKHLTFDTSLNIDGIWGGYTGPGVATILPEVARAKIDSRLVPDQTIASAVGMVRSHLDRHGYGDIAVTQLGGGDEWSRTSVTAPVVQAVLAVYRRYGIEPAIWPRSAGSSPQAQYTRAPLDLGAAGGGLGHGGRAHAVDEYFVVEGNDQVAGLVRCEQSIVDILYTYAHWPVAA